MGYTFRRARRTPAKPLCPKAEKRVRKALDTLHCLEKVGKCQVLYGDESGFCLQPCVPYLWQKKGAAHTVRLPSQSHSKRLSVLGFLQCQTDCKTQQFYSFPTAERVTAQHLVDSIEALLPQLPGVTQPTVIVLDNAALHRSKLVQGKQSEWKRKGVRLWFLPPYCPHLNRIETLWKHVKHRWLAPADYADFATLTKSVNDILDNIGSKYHIIFA